MTVPALLVLALLAGDEMPATSAAGVEGRPPAAHASPLQARVDAAPPGATISVGPGTYAGDLILEKPITLAGRGRPLLVGSGSGSVVLVRAKGVRLEGFDIDGRGGGDLMRDTAGVHVAAAGAVVRDCRIRATLFGVYLREAPGSAVESCTIRGIAGKDPGEKGSGIHVWNTDGFVLTDNAIEQVRDGFYIQSSPHGRIRGNVARDLRYGVHYMFSDDNVFEDNLFENGAAGAALMYSRRIVFARNRFLHNRGFASVGLLLKSCDDVTAESNLIADNARGVFLEGANGNHLRGNVIAASDTAIVLYDSCAGTRIEGNSFVGNLTPLTLVGRRTDTRFEHNYWSDNDGPDLDGDGFSDRPYRLSSVFDHFRGNLTAADLFTQGTGAAALAVAEKMFPVLDPLPVEDPAPLARPPRLPEVPRVLPRAGRLDAAGMAGSALALGGGLAALLFGRR
jgi:nitrous oxidase accessory protein